jgi:hypothetical protein
LGREEKKVVGPKAVWNMIGRQARLNRARLPRWADAKFASQYCQMFEQARDSNNDFFMVHLSIPTPAEEIDTQQCH